jgi:uncharacterized lipoprotein YmbA
MRPDSSRGRRPGLTAICAATLLGGCALLGKGKPLELRYFELSAESARTPAHTGNAPSQQPATSAQRLRLGTISAARHLDRRFVERTSAQEFRYHDEWRWTDQPEVFLRRALSRELFERAGVTRVLSGVAPTLEVELTALEERSKGERTRAVAAALAVLHDDRAQLWQRSLEVSVEVGEGEPASALADAMGRALGELCARLAAETLAMLPAAVSE